MAEIDSELIYEILKNIQQRMDRLENGIGEVKQEMISVRLSMMGMQNDIHNVYGILGRQEERLERIEKRLELRELAEPQQPYENE